eukprot:TRINITY_DN4149_c0_g1_i3.p5 TRINITY_DN4149_c0_g1~~TRINITY_DN4149_c0_g1_i3.p5  ORF type:complete len:127 (-),score=13.13 TRINITY_DN4149_c0_g1_i3:877-1257(-)
MYQFCGGVFIMVVLVQGVFNRELQQEYSGSPTPNPVPVPVPVPYCTPWISCVVDPCWVASCPGVPEAICHPIYCDKPIWFLGQWITNGPCGAVWENPDDFGILSKSECQGSGSDLVTGIDGEEENY